ncbi:hypothetical protein BD324DRAFT_620480 [Kockovaella imperatae]|uniref:Peptidase M20 dimerisation domain-containing protein n=1 Tax=Kockovaella imperatae TaxID=4999 RepID=A0A1Y1UK18_9TREE|nr:hypothetical protein BD324DRAFT_620480 [Kockovaella imperatae]ORX38339.1 hypothetical protein BD324DRAFT_620480 [Kockovaella imperatae]
MGSSAEYSSLPTASTQPQKKDKQWYRPLLAITAIFLLARFGSIPQIISESTEIFGHGHKHHKDAGSSGCQQAEPILPKSLDVSSLVEGQDDRIIEWLGGSVRIPTEIFDVMGEVGEDPRWDIFYKHAEYLEKAYPLIHQHLKRTRVMTHALIYEWIGSDPDLKPLLLTGHQDVVPVLNATRGLWSHDPFGGEYDAKNGRIWGRGSADDKSGVIGMMSAIELLLESGKFTPSRTVVLALGIDEETGGKVGAYNLGLWIEAKYGKDSMAMLVDEGNGLHEMWGQLYAAPAVAEKGYLDVEITVQTKGGHSSVPPEHSGIGYTAELVRALERNPHKPKLLESSPLVSGMVCYANTAPEMPTKLKKSVRKLEKSMSKKGAKADTKALKDVEEWFVSGSLEDHSLPRGLGKAMVSTTQAIDIINGGLKINALPEVVTTVVNHRINIASSVEELQQHLIKTLSPVAEEYNLALEAFGKDIELKGCPYMMANPSGKVILAEAFNSSLNPAPISPFTTEDAAWRLLAGTSRGIYSSRPGANLNEVEAAKELYFSPSMSTGNTDTKRYWNLTRNIYRFAYSPPDDPSFPTNAHTVDESVSAKSFVEEVRWFAALIVNVDESREV